MLLRAAALAALQIRSPTEKCLATQALVFGEADLANILTDPGQLPGRLDRPPLVAPKALIKRSLQNIEGRAALIHALAHIELNATNLALDIIWRFAAQPLDFYKQWLSVAHDEARHFMLLSDHLNTLGFEYGDFPAHNSLWEMAEKTKHDLLARLALVPRTLEARGLDAAPLVRNKLQGLGDKKGVEILTIILNDEVGHVAIGNYWYRQACQLQALDPIATYAQLALTYQAPAPHPPFNIEGRRAAGFTEAELVLLLESTQR